MDQSVHPTETQDGVYSRRILGVTIILSFTASLASLIIWVVVGQSFFWISSAIFTLIYAVDIFLFLSNAIRKSQVVYLASLYLGLFVGILFFRFNSPVFYLLIVPFLLSNLFFSYKRGFVYYFFNTLFVLGVIIRFHKVLMAYFWDGHIAFALFVEEVIFLCFFTIALSLIVQLMFAGKNYYQRETIKVIENLRDIIKVTSHDVRGGIGSINTLFSFLYNEDSEKMGKEEIGLLAKSTYNLEGLVENVFRYINISDDSHYYEPRSHLLHGVLSDLRDRATVLLYQKKIEVVLYIDPNTKIYGDLPTIELVFRNILFNSIKFSNENSIIEVHAKTIKKEVEISFIDQGIGIDEDQLAKIKGQEKLKPQKGTGNEIGSGFGFLVIRKFLKVNKATMEIESTKGKGTTVRLGFCPNEESFLSK